MTNINFVFLSGRLVRDPDIRFTAKGSAIGGFTIGLNKTWKDKDGNDKESKTFVNCTAFGKHADALTGLNKGDPIAVEGELQLDTWDDKATGQKRSMLKIIVERVLSIYSGSKDPDEPTYHPRPQIASQPSPEPSKPMPDEDPDSVPF